MITKKIKKHICDYICYLIILSDQVDKTYPSHLQ